MNKIKVIYQVVISPSLRGLLLLFLVFIGLSSCELNEEFPVFEAKISSVSLDPFGSELTPIQIVSNREVKRWEVELLGGEDWVEVVKVEQTNIEDDKFTGIIYLKPRTAYDKVEPRIAQISIKSDESIPIIVDVKQAKLQIGDMYAGGIVFWLNDDVNAEPDNRGKVVCMKEMDLEELNYIDLKFGFEVMRRNFWQILRRNSLMPLDIYTKDVEIFLKSWEGSSKTDGKANTKIIRELSDKLLAKKDDIWGLRYKFYMYSSDNPETDMYYGKAWNGSEWEWYNRCIVDAKESGYDDWYIPAIEEFLLWNKDITIDGETVKVYDVIKKAMIDNGGVPLNPFYSLEDLRKDPAHRSYADVYYASSTQADASYGIKEDGFLSKRIFAIYLDPAPDSGRKAFQVIDIGKTRNGLIRAIRSF